LTGLSAGLFLLKETDRAAGDGTRAQLYSAMEASQHKLSLYVKNILNEARMEEGRFRIEKRPLALRELAEGAVESLAELLQQKKLRLTKVFPERPLFVDADYEALSLVISNILGNSVKYTSEGGSIRIKVEESGDGSKVIFSVSDTGIGISLEEMEKITSGFYRTQAGQSAAAGFGLGLRITNELLGLHGSTLQISSEKGKGSRFFFELPVYRPAPERGKKG
jgi:signal transduction histidine kinase